MTSVTPLTCSLVSKLAVSSVNLLQVDSGGDYTPTPPKEKAQNF